MIAFWVNSICEHTHTHPHIHRIKEDDETGHFLPVGSACSAFIESVSFHRRKKKLRWMLSENAMPSALLVIILYYWRSYWWHRLRHGQSIEWTRHLAIFSVGNIWGQNGNEQFYSIAVKIKLRTSFAFHVTGCHLSTWCRWRSHRKFHSSRRRSSKRLIFFAAGAKIRCAF